MILGWIVVGVVGALFGAAVIGFWDKISHWLTTLQPMQWSEYWGNNGARQRMHRSYFKNRPCYGRDPESNGCLYEDELDSMMDKVTMEADASPYEIDQQVLKEINQKGKLVQEFEYKQ